MTIEELRDYVSDLETDGEIPYYIYSNLIDMIDTLNVISIPKDATNGDMIEEMFPNIETWIVKQDIAVKFNDMLTIKLFPLVWWNTRFRENTDGSN